MLFTDRQDAGRHLAQSLLHLKDRQPVILALPRGGVPVGFEIAMRLEAPLGLVLVRKIGAPDMPELAIGAVVDGSSPERFIDARLVEELQVTSSYVEQEIARQTSEIERRRTLYLKGRPLVDVDGRTAILVDDGVATGATMRVALRAARQRRAKHLVMAVPVAPARTIEELRPGVDEVVCLSTPEDFMAIGQFYSDFRQLTDQEVIAFLDRAAARRKPPPDPATP